MGSHALAVQCKYLLQTDCGVIFDPYCVDLMVRRLEMDPNIAGTSCFQRVMSAEQQGEEPGEIWRSPINALLRISQQCHMEDAVFPTRLLNIMLGFAIVIPGCGGLYRRQALGSMEEGPIKKYFDLCIPPSEDDPKEGVILGNVRLAEDRILPTLAMFQTPEECRKRGITRPRLCYLTDAICYFEAEYPMDSLVKQHRRWSNGALFRSIWMYNNCE